MKWILVVTMVAATALSDLLQSYEMKNAGKQSVRPRGLMRLLINCLRAKRLWPCCGFGKQIQRVKIEHLLTRPP